MGWGGDYGWRPYVPVAEKKSMALTYAAKIAKKQGREPSPVKVSGRKIAQTFWGTAWCDNLEAYSDFANRLPRGATYVRNGSVVDLVIKPGRIEAIVAGSETYTVSIKIAPLATSAWKKIKTDCSSSIDSLLDLLGGRLSDGVMQRLTRPKEGLFPAPKEIELNCSCPDYSYCCKHIAAVMYGIGNRLDSSPELLFLLRKVDHQELVTQAVAEGNLNRELASQSSSSLANEDLGAMFGIELETGSTNGETDATNTGRSKRGRKVTKTVTTTKVSQVVASESKTKVTRRAKPAEVVVATSVETKKTTRVSAKVRSATVVETGASVLPTTGRGTGRSRKKAR